MYGRFVSYTEKSTETMALTVHWPAARYRLFGSLVPCQSLLSSNGTAMYFFPCGLFFSEGGLWDETGCRVESSDESQTLCVCSHLSTFAVLMDVHDYVVSGLEWKVTNSCFGLFRITCGSGS
jgi:hypothetical protein